MKQIFEILLFPEKSFFNFFRSAAACSPAELIVQVTSVCVDSATDGRMCDVKLFLKSLLVLEFYSILTKPGTHILRTSAHKTLEQILEILLHSPKVPIFTLKKFLKSQYTSYSFYPILTKFCTHVLCSYAENTVEQKFHSFA